MGKHKNSILFFIVSLLLTIYLGFAAGMGVYESMSIGLMVFSILDFLDNIGKKLVVLHIPIILAVFTWLIMPVIFYEVYTEEDHLARIFYKYMPIPAEEYFSFVFPGTLTMIAGFRFPLARLQITKDPQGYKQKLETYFMGKAKVGFILIGIGLATGFLKFLAPASLNNLFHLMSNLSYVGVFYIFFSDNKHKNKILLGVLSLMVVNAIASGIFGQLVFLLTLFYILISLYLKKIPFFVKLSFLVIGVTMIFLIQNVKKAYREEAWVRGGDASYFGQLLVEEIQNPSVMFDKKNLFFTAIRMNQGWLIGVTMDRVPRRFEYAHGETILMSVAAAFVPRIIWPGKPEAGGKYNLKRFWGYNLVGYSMNIGPIGEAYANFGVNGGIIFMFFYGLFFNALLTMLLKWSEKRPSLLCWIPFLFYYAVVVETDILTTVGSIVTSLIFMLLTIRLFKKLFNINL